MKSRTLRLVGEEERWRVRVGDWRIAYRNDDGRLVVLVLEAGWRKEVDRRGLCADAQFAIGDVGGVVGFM